MELEGTLDATVTDHGVEFEFIVENVGDGEGELQFQSGRKADVAVYDAADREGLPRLALSKGEPEAELRSGTPHDEAEATEVWRWSDGRMFTQVLESRTLNPGETTEFVFTWDGPESGEYVAVATLEAEEDCLSSTEFAV